MNQSNPAPRSGEPRGSTLTSKARDYLRDDIVAGRLGPQVSLVEAEIAERLSMSKTPVREALLMLVREGLVEINEFRGARVRDFSQADVLEIFQLRSVLEPLAVRLSFDTIGTAEIEHLNELLERARQMERKRNWLELARLNRAFHDGLYATCPNQRVLAILGELADVIQLIGIRGWNHRPSHTLELEQHGEILKTLYLDRDIEAGCDLLVRHVFGFVETHQDDGSF